MASAVHCIMCFEALDAELNNREPLSLDKVQASWASFVSASSPAPAPAPAPRRTLDTTASESETSSTFSLLSSASHAASTPATSTSSLPLAADAPASAPLFVTWNTVEDDGDTSLRGCIGTFEAQPLSVGLPEYAVISAIHDTRFSPISRAELPTLQAAVTLLTDFEEVEDPFDWDIGVHGIRLSFYDRGRRYGSTYLPDVASEQGWDKDETLLSLIRKAGWVGSRSRWKDLDLKVTRYQGKKCSLEYPRFKEWRDWVAANKS
ncbi:AMMECR1 domain-containing protein [Stachybotrys elegans]|uniref:AMMECR1 domain-containing protein n=1 Tax=Stachybotrys elegans TaxID=80388 RepID=A0A8K0WU78_9HYPO|nr:AMMECR1 domain-containing protein [Stachybotrys elegans]